MNIRRSMFFTLSALDAEFGHHLLASNGLAVKNVFEAFGKCHFQCDIRDEHQLAWMVSELERQGASPQIVREPEFSQQEIDDAELLFLRVDAEDFSVPVLPAEFSGGCERCDSGAEQVSELSVLWEKKCRPPDRFLVCVSGYRLVPRHIAESLHTLGIETRSLRTRIGAKLAGFRQIIPNVTLEPFHRSTTGIERNPECSFCLREGHCTSRSDPFVPVLGSSNRSNVPNWPPPISATYECFGHGRGHDGIKRYGPPQSKIALNQSVRAILEAESSDTSLYHWTPIAISDEN